MENGEEDLFFFGTNRITICLRDVLSAHAGPFNLSSLFTLPVDFEMIGKRVVDF